MKIMKRLYLNRIILYDKEINIYIIYNYAINKFD